jgi:menaquinone-9 beta-reductase
VLLWPTHYGALSHWDGGSITGEGLALSFRQAVALADALTSNDLRRYQSAHSLIQRVPAFMSATMLLMDRFPALRRHSLASFERSPELFARMLKVHVGAVPFHWLGHEGVMQLAWGLITA